MKKNFIIWQEKWATGIKTIDDQHKHFIGIVNRANVLNEEKKNKVVLGQILIELKEYAQVHFSTEEGYFEDTEYPQTEEHEKKHQILVGKVLKFSQRFEAEEDVSKLVEEFLEFLRDWLDTHLVKVDAKYIPWLTEHGVK